MTDVNDEAGYDVIGDVHGHADALTQLLTSMDYVERGGAWRHDNRQAIFVGDLIDRGPKQKESVDLVRTMVEAGAAQMVLGNHEFNAIAYATPDGEGGFLRPHGDENNKLHVKNELQHKEFLDAVGFGTELHCEMIEWFMTVPLWLDLGGLRVVHACWSGDHIDVLRPLVSESNTLTEELVVTASTKGHPTYDAIETIVKGPEISLGDQHYLDKDGNCRDRARIAWWEQSATNPSPAPLIPGGAMILDGRCPSTSDHDEPTAADDHLVFDSDVPVIFGHYWWSAERGLTSDQAVCIDYSIAKEGELVAYRWTDEKILSDARIVRAN